jgi:putative transposase
VRQSEPIRLAWFDSGTACGYRKLADDPRDQGERVSADRVARLALLAVIAAQVGYKRRLRRYGGKAAAVPSYDMDRQSRSMCPTRFG